MTPPEDVSGEERGDPALIRKVVAAVELAQRFRTYGHRLARINPLKGRFFPIPGSIRRLRTHRGGSPPDAGRLDLAGSSRGRADGFGSDREAQGDLHRFPGLRIFPCA